MTTPFIRPLSGGYIVTDDQDLTRVMFGTEEEAQGMLDATYPDQQKKAKQHETHTQEHVQQRSSKGSK